MATYVFSLGLILVQEWIAQALHQGAVRTGSAALCHPMAQALMARRLAGGEILLPKEPPWSSWADHADINGALASSYRIADRAFGFLNAAACEDAGRRIAAVTIGLLGDVRDGFRRRRDAL